MKLPNRPATLNRTVLFVAGIVLLAGGAFELTTAYGLLHLVPRDQSLRFLNGRPYHWTYYVAVVVAVVVGLLALRWLAAQTRRRPRTRRWRIGGDSERGVSTMDADTAAAPLTADLQSYPGVRAAVSSLAGPRHNPRLHVRLRTEYDADLTELRRRIHGHALPRLCAALELDTLPTTVHITPTGATTRTR